MEIVITQDCFSEQLRKGQRLKGDVLYGLYLLNRGFAEIYRLEEELAIKERKAERAILKRKRI